MLHLVQRNKALCIVWLVGCLNIIYQGQFENSFQVSSEINNNFCYPFGGVTVMSLFFSAYFIVSLFFRLIKFNQNHPILAYLICSLIVLIQFFIALLSAMHAPPFIAAYIQNVLLLLLYQLLSLPTLFKKQT